MLASRAAIGSSSSSSAGLVARAREGGPLGLPTGQGRRPPLRLWLQSDPLKPELRGCRCLRPSRPARAQAEGNVLEHGEVRKQQVVLEDHRDGPSLGRNEDPRRRFVQHGPVEDDAPSVERQESRQAAEQRRLPRAIGPEHRDHFARFNRQVDIELEGVDAEAHPSLEAHDDPSQRSRSPISTASETANSTRLNTIAASGLLSSAR